MMGVDKQDPPPGRSIDTGGGAYFEKEVRVEGGDLVGRDKIVNITNIFAKQALSAVEEAEKQQDLEKKHLAQGVNAFVQRLQARAQETADTGGPYKGLLEYRLSDAELFFGRGEAIQELLQHLQRAPMTVLHAESGAGKTSLLQAGIAPRLLANGYLSVRLRQRDINPGLALKGQFLTNFNRTPDLVAAPLRAFLYQVCDVLGPSTAIYVFLDQFEEFFIQLKESKRVEFIEALAECLYDESLNVKWVLSLRTDFFGHLASFRPHVLSPFENDYMLNRLTRAEAREAVIKPAEQHGISFEPQDLVDTLLDELGQDAIAPPQVQLVCMALYEELRRGETVISQTLYEAQGGVGGILRGHLDRVLRQKLLPEQRPAARRLLEALVTSDNRRALRGRDELVTELARQGVDKATLDAVIEQMVNNRLLRVEETGEDGAVRAYELAHDYLLEEIELDPESQTRKAAQELLGQEWRTYERYGTLLSDEKLAILEAQGEHLALNADQLDLLFRSAWERGRELDKWRDSAIRYRLTEALAECWVTALESEDPVEVNRATNLLVSLADSETASCLVTVIESQTRDGQKTPLHDPAPMQRKALVALAQMECQTAEDYLRGLTPEGFCFVPAGRFETGSDERPDEQPRGPVWVTAFWMARSPVTVDEWRRFIAANAYAQPRYWIEPEGKETKRRPVPMGWEAQQDKDHPVHNVTWYEAMAYTAWLAETSTLPVALPTEAEWEKAACWDPEIGQTRLYPWGNAPDKGRCNVRESGIGKTTAIDKYAPAGESPCGARDMAGNVLEWTRTEYHPYPYHPDDERENTSSDLPRVLRGGAFNRDLDEARCARRHLLGPAIGLSNIGCRVCLRLVPLTTGGDDTPAANGPTPG